MNTIEIARITLYFLDGLKQRRHLQRVGYRLVKSNGFIPHTVDGVEVQDVAVLIRPIVQAVDVRVQCFELSRLIR